jgi:DNA-binding transcriptional regulator YiaG
MEGELEMSGYYGAYGIKEDKEYGNQLPHYRYKPKDDFTDVGSGGSYNSNLIVIAGAEPQWRVSRFGDEIPYITVVPVNYGKWQACVLECPNQGDSVHSILTTKDKLDQIREIFGVSVSHLAKILIVSRPSIHSWLEGVVEPRDSAIERINNIHKIALRWKHLSKFHYSPGRLMRQNLGDEASMLERLAREPINDNEIQDGLNKLLVLMHRQREQMNRAKRRGVKSSLSDEEKEKTRHNLTETFYTK